MEDRACPRPVTGFKVGEFDGEAVLFHPVNHTIMHLNRTAALIWRLCDGCRTVEQIRNLLSDAYPEARSEIEVDVQRVLQLFLDHEALTIGPSRPDAVAYS